MEALLCLSVFIVVSAIWAFNKQKKQARNRRGGGGVYYLDHDQGYEDDSE